MFPVSTVGVYSYLTATAIATITNTNENLGGIPNNEIRYHRDELPTAPRASEDDVAAVGGSLAGTVRARWQNLVGQVWVVRRARGCGRVSSVFGVW